MAMYEGAVRNHENQYLFEDESGHQLIAEQKENLQSMHILKALASSLDSHTSVFDPSEAYEMRVRLEKSFQGVGIMVKQGIDGMVVTSLIPNSPAARSHKIQPNDYLIEIDGRAVDREPINNVIDLLRGKSGSEVSLLLKRAGDNKPFRVNLTREPIVINEGRVETSYEEFGNGIIGKITLHSFYQGNGISSEQDVRNAIRELSKKGNLRGLILDLRENSGGFLSQAVKVAGLFITNGVVVISKYSNGDERFYRDMDGKVAYDGPMVVLTSRLTASAAEIVAQALQDYGVAVVVGDKQTYGKGTIQSQTVTDKGGQTSYFKVTVGKYYTVSGKTPQLQGVKADIVAPSQYSLEDYDNLHEDGQFTHDSIEPAYSDSLRDIDPGLRPWYLRYYMPTLQGQKRIWQEALPKLKRNSEYRLAHNKNYQLLMEGDVDSIDEHATNARQRTYGIDDMQMNEAVNVIKD
ncbi:MAG: S41 family peptidase, partial [Chlamydiia bacterium]|nr:S41 family peptidase [Chlamydiia bacterium]